MTVKKKDTQKNEDKRRFFRIDDEVNLFYKIVDKQTVVEASQISDDLLSNCSLLTALDMLNQEARIIMYRLEKNEPEIAEYLKIQDSKIDFLAQAIMRQGNDFSKTPTRNANISASGLAFECEEAIKTGTYLEIRLLLTSCLAVIVLYGKVVYCRENKLKKDPDALKYQIGLDFTNLREEDREILIKHVVKRQMQQIRQKKEKNQQE